MVDQRGRSGGAAACTNLPSETQTPWYSGACARTPAVSPRHQTELGREVG
eukprot:COSAG04_NODE_29063_length_271_cov_0.906977_1_plen_49_part_01